MNFRFIEVFPRLSEYKLLRQLFSFRRCGTFSIEPSRLLLIEQWRTFVSSYFLCSSDVRIRHSPVNYTILLSFKQLLSGEVIVQWLQEVNRLRCNGAKEISLFPGNRITFQKLHWQKFQFTSREKHGLDKSLNLSLGWHRVAGWYQVTSSHQQISYAF